MAEVAGAGFRSGRSGLRVLRAKARREGNRDWVAQINEVLRNADLEDAVAVAIDDEYTVYYRAQQDVSGGVLDFLDWLIQNADSIMALIVKLIDLFS